MSRPQPQRQYATMSDFYSEMDKCPRLTRDDSELVIAGLCSQARGRCLAEEMDLDGVLGDYGLSDSGDAPALFQQPGRVLDNSRGQSFRHLKPLEPKPRGRPRKTVAPDQELKWPYTHA
jgi:hypothetical protein